MQLHFSRIFRTLPTRLRATAPAPLPARDSRASRAPRLPRPVEAWPFMTRSEGFAEDLGEQYALR